MGKGEIAHYEQFLLFPQRFQKACFPGVSKGVVVWEWVKLKSRLQIPSILISLNFVVLFKKSSTLSQTTNFRLIQTESL